MNIDDIPEIDYFKSPLEAIKKPLGNVVINCLLESNSYENWHPEEV
jgi:hypothetical protein